jgi:hypothetical protein
MLKLVPVHRACGSCTACCDGHLTGEAYGKKFYPGKKCAFIGPSGCSIYDLRPKNPCVTFLCAYKNQHSLPEWTRPDLSNVIFVQRIFEDIPYLHGSDTGRQPIPELFDWARNWAMERQKYILIPRKSFRKSTDGYHVAIFGPDDQLEKLYLSKYPSITVS